MAFTDESHCADCGSEQRMIGSMIGGAGVYERHTPEACIRKLSASLAVERELRRSEINELKQAIGELSRG